MQRVLLNFSALASVAELSEQNQPRGHQRSRDLIGPSSNLGLSWIFHLVFVLASPF